MPIGALITAGGAVAGGLIAKSGAEKAAKIQTGAADKASETQLKMYETTRGDLEPFRQVGRDATYSLASLYGLDGGEPFSSSSLEAFRNSPDYQFPFQEGVKAIEASRAAKGLLHSGGTATELAQYGQGLASQNFGNYVSRLLSLAGMGQNAAAQTGTAAIQTGQGVANSQLAGGEAAASGVVGGTNALTSTIGNLSSNLSLYRLMNPGSSSYASSLPKFNQGYNPSTASQGFIY